jgi:hypothetical protein
MNLVYPGKAEIAIGYVIAAAFRDVIYERDKSFPLLFLFGEKQSGKSKFAWSLNEVFNSGMKPYNLTSGTGVAFHRRLARVKNGLAWYDEYTNDIDERRFQALKASFDGTGHEKGLATRDNRSEVTKVQSACMLSGQYMPTRDDGSLLTRSILLSFLKRIFTVEDIKNYNKLKEYEGEGVTGLACDILHYREIIEKYYNQTFDELFNDNRDALTAQCIPFDERVLRNFTVIHTVIKLFIEKATDIKLGIDYNRFSREILSMISEQSMLIASGEALATFWNMVEFLSDQNMIHADRDFMINSRTSIVLRTASGNIEEKQFRFPDGREFPKTLLWIRWTKIYPLYMEYHRKQYGSNGLDKNSINHYLKTSPYYLGYQDSARIGDINTSAYVFDYAKLKEMGVNLDRGVVTVNKIPDPEIPKDEDLDIKKSEF